jgi:hypothetical protein
LNRLLLDLVGWTATATFACSYFVKDQQLLRRIQAFAALIWIAYGLAIGSAPLIGSNVLVAALAFYSSRRQGRPSPGAP